MDRDKGFGFFIIVYWGRAPGYMEAWRTRYNRPIRLLMGIFMLGIGSAMLVGVL
jgi:hypothetical protein